jgi:hypothetical protein
MTNHLIDFKVFILFMRASKGMLEMVYLLYTFELNLDKLGHWPIGKESQNHHRHYHPLYL